MVLRTVNKKYYKRFDIPDIKRLGMKLDESCLAWKYQNNTVLIFYDKPREVIQAEQQKISQIKKLGNDGPSFAVGGAPSIQTPMQAQA